MPNSMTGFGRAEGEVEGRRMTVEAKTVNHKYLDLRLCLPPELESFEIEIQGLIKERLNRGRVELKAALGPSPTPGLLQWDQGLARSYLAVMKQMQSEMGVSGTPDLALLLAQKDVIIKTGNEPFSAPAWEAAKGIVQACLIALAKSRAAEGKSLAADLAERREQLQTRIGRVRSQAPRGVEAFRERLNRRVQELGTAVDPQRLAQEVVLFADRSDVSEELTRLSTHAAKFGEILAEAGAVGRRLDFLLQEMHREANTIGAKIQDAELSQEVVEIKAELERMREQVQNLE